MIAIPQSSLKAFRAITRRLFGRAILSNVWLRFSSRENQSSLRVEHNGAALEFKFLGDSEAAEFTAPLEALAACEGPTAEPVTFAPLADGRVVIEWSDRGIPRQKHCQQTPKTLPEFPPDASSVWSTDAGLLKTFATAGAITDGESSRYALGCLSLRGSSGSIAVTDGRQLAVERGFAFPWTEDLLVPANDVFKAKELQRTNSISIGATDKHVVVTSGPWKVFLAIDKLGRFPAIDGNLRPESAAKSRLTLAPADAEFLLPRLHSLPLGSDDEQPITLVLDEEVRIRASGDEQSRPTEIVLTKSSYEGETIQVTMNRQYLARALKSGFLSYLVFAADAPIQCQDERRTYVWAVLEPRETPAGAEPVRIESSIAANASPAASEVAIAAAKSQPAAKTIRKRRVRVASPVETASRAVNACPAENAPEMAGAATVSAKSVSAAAVSAATISSSAISLSAAADNPIEAAQALRKALRETLVSTNTLLRSLRRQQRQERIVTNTLASLRQLNRLAG